MNSSYKKIPIINKHEENRSYSNFRAHGGYQQKNDINRDLERDRDSSSGTRGA
jgi:hypothetical protein